MAMTTEPANGQREEFNTDGRWEGPVRERQEDEVHEVPPPSFSLSLARFLSGHLFEPSFCRASGDCFLELAVDICLTATVPGREGREWRQDKKRGSVSLLTLFHFRDGDVDRGLFSLRWAPDKARC